jgi:anti-sigma-K factor RskA
MNQPSDIHALSGAYAVDALDDAERTEFERHLAECAACRAEVASFQETSALIAGTEAVAPPASLRDRVLAATSQVRPLPPSTTVADDEPAEAATVTALRRRRLPAMLAAAAAVVLLAVGAVLWHPWHQDTTSLADQILHAPDAQRVVETLPGNGGELTLVRSVSLRRAVMVADHVPPPQDGKTYQLWLDQPGEGMVSAGLMPDAAEPTVLTGDAATADAAAISVEPEAGSSHPTTDPLALFPLTSGTGEKTPG